MTTRISAFLAKADPEKIRAALDRFEADPAIRSQYANSAIYAYHQITDGKSAPVVSAKSARDVMIERSIQSGRDYQNRHDNDPSSDEMPIRHIHPVF